MFSLSCLCKPVLRPAGHSSPCSWGGRRWGVLGADELTLPSGRGSPNLRVVFCQSPLHREAWSSGSSNNIPRWGGTFLPSPDSVGSGAEWEQQGEERGVVATLLAICLHLGIPENEQRVSRRALDNLQGSPSSFTTFLPNSLCPHPQGHYFRPDKRVLSNLCASPLHSPFQMAPSSLFPASRRLPTSPLWRASLCS